MDRLMRILSTEGVVDTDVVDRAERSLVGSHWIAVQRYLATGYTDGLDVFVVKPWRVSSSRPAPT